MPRRSPTGSAKIGRTQLILSSAGRVTAPKERTETQSREPLESSPGRSPRGKADRMRQGPKSMGALERDGSGRTSEDARGQHNRGRAKDPWGAWLRSHGDNGPDMPIGQPEQARIATRSEGESKPDTTRRSPDLAEASDEVRGRLSLTAGHAAFKPYWGKPAVRNFRGDAGNGVMAARGRHFAEMAEQQPGLTKPVHHRACILLDAGKTGAHALD